MGTHNRGTAGKTPLVEIAGHKCPISMEMCRIGYTVNKPCSGDVVCTTKQ